MFKPVYVTRDTSSNYVKVIPAHVGIIKLQGCVEFYPARKWQGAYGYSSAYGVGGEKICLATCHTRYSGIPKQGEAWLVEDGRKYITWTRVDKDMYILDSYGNIIE